jgi:hypothetical protein
LKNKKDADLSGIYRIGVFFIWRAKPGFIRHFERFNTNSIKARICFGGDLQKYVEKKAVIGYF